MYICTIRKTTIIVRWLVGRSSGEIIIFQVSFLVVLLLSSRINKVNGSSLNMCIYSSIFCNSSRFAFLPTLSLLIFITTNILCKLVLSSKHDTQHTTDAKNWTHEHEQLVWYGGFNKSVIDIIKISCYLSAWYMWRKMLLLLHDSSWD